MISTTPFARLEAINNQIAGLRAEYNRLLDQLRAEFNGAAAAGPAPAAASSGATASRGGRPSAKAGPKAGGARRGRPPGRSPGTVAAPQDGSTAPAAGAPAKGKRGRSRKSPLQGRKRPKSPSGELGPAVIQVLTRAGRPLRTNEIMDGLVADKYVFTSSSPKQTLSARIYKLKGVRQTGPGTFAVEEAATPATAA